LVIIVYGPPHRLSGHPDGRDQGRTDFPFCGRKTLL
jgi:hypothetical protein